MKTSLLIVIIVLLASIAGGIWWSNKQKWDEEAADKAKIKAWIDMQPYH